MMNPYLFKFMNLLVVITISLMIPSFKPFVLQNEAFPHHCRQSNYVENVVDTVRIFDQLLRLK